MNRKGFASIIILLIAAVVLVGGLVLYFSQSAKAPASPTGVTQDQALNIVENLPDVKAFMTRVKANHGDPHVGVGDQTDIDEAGNAYWTVQVYENLIDHNSTFAWYEVYVKDGRIVNLSQ